MKRLLIALLFLVAVLSADCPDGTIPVATGSFSCVDDGAGGMLCYEMTACVYPLPFNLFMGRLGRPDRSPVPTFTPRPKQPLSAGAVSLADNRKPVETTTRSCGVDKIISARSASL